MAAVVVGFKRGHRTSKDAAARELLGTTASQVYSLCAVLSLKNSKKCSDGALFLTSIGFTILFLSRISFSVAIRRGSTIGLWAHDEAF